MPDCVEPTGRERRQPQYAENKREEEEEVHWSEIIIIRPYILQLCTRIRSRGHELMEPYLHVCCMHTRYGPSLKRCPCFNILKGTFLTNCSVDSCETDWKLVLILLYCSLYWHTKSWMKSIASCLEQHYRQSLAKLFLKNIFKRLILFWRKKEETKSSYFVFFFVHIR